MNLCLAIVMFGVALGIRTVDFKNLLKQPRAGFLGIFSQFIFLPAITFGLVLLIKPTPSVALGLIMVASCPGGNVSNFMTHLAGGNTALSVSLTAFASLAAIVMTPINLQFWGNQYEPTRQILQQVSVDPVSMIRTVSLIMGLPLVLGMWCQHRWPLLADKMVKWLQPLSIVILIAFVAVAFGANFDIFLQVIHIIALIVLAHNALALSGGYLLARVFSLPLRERKTLTIETGIQNSGLGLILIFTFFDGLGGMALIAGWWGVWDIVSGLTVSWLWRKKLSSLFVKL